EAKRRLKVWRKVRRRGAGARNKNLEALIWTVMQRTLQAHADDRARSPEPKVPPPRPKAMKKPGNASSGLVTATEHPERKTTGKRRGTRAKSQTDEPAPRSIWLVGVGETSKKGSHRSQA